MRHQLTLSRSPLPRPPRPPRALPATLALLLALPAPPARAQPSPPSPAAPSSPAAAPPPTPPTQNKALAAQKYDAGAALAKQGRWQEAYPLFLEAWTHFQHWQIALSLGRVEIEVGKLRAAQQHLSFALGASDLPAKDREEVNRLLDLARAKLGALRIVATAQAPARVFLDGELLGTTPLSATEPADPGDHRVELRFGTTRQGQPVTVESGQTHDVTIDLRLPELDAPLPTSTASPSPLPTSTPETTAPQTTPWPVVIGLGAAALVGAGVGTGVWVAADGKRAEAGQVLRDSPVRVHADCAQGNNQATCDQIEGLLMEGDSLRTGAAAAWIFGGAAAVGGAVVWYLTREGSPAASPKTGVRMVPVASPQQAGVLVQGSW